MKIRWSDSDHKASLWMEKKYENKCVVDLSIPLIHFAIQHSTLIFQKISKKHLPGRIKIGDKSSVFQIACLWWWLWRSLYSKWVQNLLDMDFNMGCKKHNLRFTSLYAHQNDWGTYLCPKTKRLCALNVLAAKLCNKLLIKINYVPQVSRIIFYDFTVVKLKFPYWLIKPPVFPPHFFRHFLWLFFTRV